MVRKSIFERVKELNFPVGEYAVVGSGVLEACGIRDANDVDIVAKEELCKRLIKSGWDFSEDRTFPGSGRMFYTKENVDVMSHFWWGEKYNPETDDLIEGAEIIDGIPFVKLDVVLKWKKAANRLKDIDDVKLIEEYLQR